MSEHLWSCPACGETILVAHEGPLPDDPTDVQPVCECGELMQLDDDLQWSKQREFWRAWLASQGRLREGD